ncbi:MAG: methylated-DNA--[protein]-cysteine S-methyltransferase [Deltaproteobacteria bacterium]|jgi:methylated-DNA-[protein]-cysteine S-methyltransferase|nr:methylated-DNA--[protein]-cysteine S-methyltransferase [Deltaproteobacteria bacterium]
MKSQKFKKLELSLASIESPLGPMTAASLNDMIVGLWFDGQKHFPNGLKRKVNYGDSRSLLELKDWIEGYFKGIREKPLLIIAPMGTMFQQRVWRETASIPHGRRSTYQKIAAALSSSPRAVASALSWNPISLLIPCHRVLSSRGELCGYAGGLHRKQALLELEDAVFQRNEETLGIN